MAGAIRTGVQNAAYDKGWELAFHHEDSDDIEAAVGGYTDADDEAPDEYREPEPAEQKPERERTMAQVQFTYDCKVCGWHKSSDQEACGNATCRTYRPMRGR